MRATKLYRLSTHKYSRILLFFFNCRLSLVLNHNIRETFLHESNKIVPIEHPQILKNIVAVLKCDFMDSEFRYYIHIIKVQSLSVLVWFKLSGLLIVDSDISYSNLRLICSFDEWVLALVVRFWCDDFTNSGSQDICIHLHLDFCAKSHLESTITFHTEHRDLLADKNLLSFVFLAHRT